ncbi:hypothetical protein BCR39DRAFT_545591 [Naematelia encephala]|uniref:LIM zinc-binding domain-containing protein n=1 Tax=Naematelia encephala TaxID=71784 RepID=A0A1Y2ASC3_9TREE|nr:hypothetical protein BCR39DRAFT_545591 [Naematelia encephala]
MTPRCETCGDSVYHAEQVMGPARKIYHKSCLKCLQCSKRLDPGGLVEHDGDPYCSRCHTQLFGIRDLRQANVNPTSPTASPAKTPSRSFRHRSPSPPKQLSPRPVSTPQDYYTPPDLSRIPQTPELALSSQASTPRDPTTPITRPNFRDPRPIAVPYAGRAEALDERGLLRRGDSPRSKVGEKVVLGEELCWGCEKRVYAAEQVFAVGHKWHKGCLRCTSCKSTVDPSKVSDRDGMVYCKNCYAREHGPGGIMGKR